MTLVSDIVFITSRLAIIVEFIIDLYLLYLRYTQGKGQGDCKAMYVVNFFIDRAYSNLMRRVLIEHFLQ